MYRKVNPLSSPPPTTVQTEPEDLSSGQASSSTVAQVRGKGGLVGASASGLVPSTSSWALSSSNKLLIFCDIVLQHENYPHYFVGEASCDEEEHNGSSEDSGEEGKSNVLLKNERVSESPLNSVGESARESTRSSTSSTDSVLAELEPDNDPSNKSEYDSVSCWCGKPWQGRPMIECDECLVWFHMSCEQVRRNHVPEVFQCSRCQEKRVKKKQRSSTGPLGGGGAKEESRRGSGTKSSKKQRKSLPPVLLGDSNSYSVPQHYSEESNGLAIKPEQGNLRVEEAVALLREQNARLGATTTSPVKARHHRKHKVSNGGGMEGEQKKRKSGGGSNKLAHMNSVESSSSSCSSSSSTNGLGESSHHAPPPRLLPCVIDNVSPTQFQYPAAAAATASSISSLSNSSSPIPNNNQFDYKLLMDTQRSPIPEQVATATASSAVPLVPPKLQPQVASTSSESPPPPNLLLSSNFVVEHQPQHLAYHHLPHPTAAVARLNHPGVLVVGGSGGRTIASDSTKHTQS